MTFLLKYLFCLVFIMISIAFFTLLERKFLGYIHNRFGPMKLFFWGVFQPFSDAIKLFSKDDVKFKSLNLNIYLLFSIFCLLIAFVFWSVMSLWGVLFYSNYSLVVFICIIGSGVYFLLFMGWCSNTKYSVLGSYRSSAQSVSYEIVMIFCLLFFFYIWFSLNFMFVFLEDYISSMILLSILNFFLWFFSCFAECNRSPFDFSEGESELVSGFNTEFAGGLFSFIFIGEYSFIIIFSFINSLFFLKSYFVFLFFCLFSYLFLWVRGSFPRSRYDILMMMAWKSLCFLILCSFFLFLFSFNI